MSALPQAPCAWRISAISLRTAMAAGLSFPNCFARTDTWRSRCPMAIFSHMLNLLGSVMSTFITMLPFSADLQWVRTDCGAQAYVASRAKFPKEMPKAPLTPHTLVTGSRGPSRSGGMTANGRFLCVL